MNYRLLHVWALLFFCGLVVANEAIAQPQPTQPSARPIAPAVTRAVTTRPVRRIDPKVIERLRIPGFDVGVISPTLEPRPSPSCPAEALQADVVAIDHPMVFNRLGAQNVNWMMYALRHDIIDLKSNHTFDYTPEGEKYFQNATLNHSSRSIALRPDLRPRPLVLRVAEGGYLKVRFTNLLEVKAMPPHTTPGNPYESFPDPLPNIDHPMEHAVKDAPGTPDDQKLYRLDDQVASRVAGFHPQGLELVGSIDSDSSNTGANASSLAAPGQTREYCFYAPKEGAYLVSNGGAAFGGEGTAGNNGVGLFGAVNVQPKNARFYRAQVTEEEMRLATIGKTPTGQPVVNYEASYPDDCANGGVWCQEGKAGLPILNMVFKQRIMHGDINALILGPNKDGRFPKDTYPLESQGKQNPAVPNRLEPFREFASIFHDENAATQAFPYFFEHPELSHTLHGVRDGFMINYGSGGVGAEIIANRLKAGPMQDCVDCAYEEFFLSSFAVGDAAMLVDNPANLVISQCQPEYINDPQFAAEKEKFCVQPKDQRATQAYYPHDPANVHHSYIGDFVKFRNIHAGKEQHIFHLHNHQWLFNANDDNSNYIDAQGIGPGSGYTYEIAYGGSGNRNKTVGDAIFHCHFYPHFAQGMWYMWRNHDVFEAGTRLEVSETASGFHEKPFALQHGRPSQKSRALPDGEIVAGTPIPAIVPLPGKGMAIMPGEVIVQARNVNGEDYGSVAKVIDRATNPGYPFWVAGTEITMGSRPTTPPLDMSSIPGVVAGHDGGLPRHALAGYSEGGETKEKLNRFTAEKHIEVAKPVYYDEAGTDIEKVAMAFHAIRNHPTHKVDMGGNITAAYFVTNGQAPIPGAPYNEPCMDDKGNLLKTGGDGAFFGGATNSFINVTDALPGGVEFGADKPRIYRGANLQLDVVFNKLGYHYPQQRILTLWEDVGPLLDKTRPPEPLVLRMNSFDCAMYAHTNLVPKDFYADDYQITTPTDVIGQHIHLPKWDLTSGDGSANGWNYEDGTFSPGMVRERIHAINKWNEKQTIAGLPTIPNPYNGSSNPLTPTTHPYFGTLTAHQQSNCVKLWDSVGGDSKAFEKKYGMPGVCDWLGARTTLQRWFSDPLVNTGGVHRGLGITFTHDHLGPSTHQQLGLYATMLTEPPGSEWRHNETGDLLYDTTARMDGGPTSWQAVITNKKGGVLDTDKDGKDDSHREFFLQYGDFQHAYQKDHFYGVDKKGIIKPATTDSFRYAIHPSVRKPAPSVFPDIIGFEPTCPGGTPGIPGAVYNSTVAPPRPCAESISADDVGMMVVNYRNEPVAARVYDESKQARDGKSGDQATSFAGDMAFAMQTRTDRAISVLNGIGGEDPSIASSTPHYATDVNFHRLKGDPYTPIMRAYAGDLVRVKVQAGSHEHEHNGSINALGWMQGGSGFGQAPHSGWRNSQNAGLSEQFTFSARITDYESPTHLNDRMYTIDTGQDGLWSGTWGVLRSLNRRDEANDKLTVLPSNPKPTLLAPDQGLGRYNDCPKGSLIRRYYVSAVLANKVLDNSLGVNITNNPLSASLNPAGGTLVYNPRATTISIQTTNDDGTVTTQAFGSGPLHDPTAIMFVRNQDIDPATGKIRAGYPVEPVVIRAAAGECVQVVLYNRLPRSRNAMPDLDGYTSLSGIVRRDIGSAGSKMTSFNNNLIRPSNRIGLHPQLVHYDVQAYDGNNIGTNKISTIAPGWAKVYQWYAGVVELAPSKEVCTNYQDTDAADKFKQLSASAGTPNLRPLTELMTPEAFQEVVLTTLDPKYADSGKVSTEIEVAAKDISKLALDAGCIETVPSGTLLTSDARTKAGYAGLVRTPSALRALAVDAVEDEAPLLGSDAYFRRESVLDDRKKCTANLNLEKQIETRLVNVRTGTQKTPAELADTVSKSFVFEVDGIDTATKQPAYGWREKGYPELNAETTRLASLSKEACRFVPVEFGATNLSPPDRIKQGQKGAVGAMIIEPKGASWSEFKDDTAIDRQNPGVNQVNKRATRATANVAYPIVNNDDTISKRSFRDLVLVHQKAINLRYGKGGPVANLAAEKEDAAEDPLQTAPEDAHDSGHMAINYGAEPLWYRFGLAPDAPFGKPGFGGAEHAWQAFSNTCCNNGGTVTTAQANVQEPYVPIMTANAGEEMRIRTLLPTGTGRASVVGFHGHNWLRDPYLAENVDAASFPDGNTPSTWLTPSQCIGDNPMGMGLGGQESVTPMAHFDMVFPQAGGKHKISGDYLWRDHGGFGITNGVWAVVRVKDNGVVYPSDPLRNNCR
jgi:manganese oxidase